MQLSLALSLSLLGWAGTAVSLPQHQSGTSDSSRLIPRDGTQGQASYYEPSISKDKDHPLACGDYGLSDDELLVALPKAVFTQDLCHKTIWAQVNDPRSSQNGKRVDNIKIVDLCPEPNAEGQGCGPTKVDLSDGAAKAVYGDDYTQPGVFNIEWGIA